MSLLYYVMPSSLYYFRHASVDMLLKYAKWILDRDQMKGASIFVERAKLTDGKGELEESVVMEKLSPYVQASVAYLEFLINVKNSMVISKKFVTILYPMLIRIPMHLFSLFCSLLARVIAYSSRNALP